MKFYLEIDLTEEEAAHPWQIEDHIQGVAYSVNQFQYAGKHNGIKWFLDPMPKDDDVEG